MEETLISVIAGFIAVVMVIFAIAIIIVLLAAIWYVFYVLVPEVMRERRLALSKKRRNDAAGMEQSGAREHRIQPPGV